VARAQPRRSKIRAGRLSCLVPQPAYCHLTIDKTARQHIPSAVEQTIVHMSRHHRTGTVAKNIGCDPRTVRRVVALARATGDVIRKPVVAGRPRKLNGCHMAVRALPISRFSFQY
jgi:hypothetical protein